MDLKGINNIIFDLGGVILNINYHITQQAFEALGIANFNEIYSQAQQSTLFDKLETGEISSQEFRDRLNHICQKNFSSNEIDNAWNAMLLDMPVDRIELLESLKKDYRLFLLSNTNQIHIPAFKRTISKAGLSDRFEALFEGLYFSSEIGYRKPNSEAFEYILDKHDLKKEEVLFIDDSIQHVKGARAIGLRSYHLQKDEDITDIF